MVTYLSYAMSPTTPTAHTNEKIRAARHQPLNLPKTFMVTLNGGTERYWRPKASEAASAVARPHSLQ